MHLQGFHGAPVSLLQLSRDWYSWCVCIIFTIVQRFLVFYGILGIYDSWYYHFYDCLLRYSWCVCIIFSCQRQVVSCQVQLVENGIFSQRLGNRRMPTQGCMLRPRALMRRKCATAAAWARGGFDDGEKTPQKSHFPPTQNRHRREKQTGGERNNDPSTHLAGSPEPKKR